MLLTEFNKIAKFVKSFFFLSQRYSTVKIICRNFYNDTVFCLHIHIHQREMLNLCA